MKNGCSTCESYGRGFLREGKEKCLSGRESPAAEGEACSPDFTGGAPEEGVPGEIGPLDCSGGEVRDWPA